MKKLKLKALELGANEVLTRAQLKNVLGGGGLISTTGGPCQANHCFDDTDCTNPMYPVCNNSCGQVGGPLWCGVA